MPEVTVLFIGIGYPAPTFIRNRILQLDETDRVKAIVFAPQESFKNLLLKNGIILPQLPIRLSLRNTIIPLIWFCILFPVSTIKLWSSLNIYPFRTRIKMFIKYHSLVRVKEIDIVHFQWIVSPEEISWARDFFKVPVIISARGSQLTIYPVTEPGYEDTVRQSLRSTDYIHAVSRSMAEACIKFGADSDKVFVNYNGINIKRFNNTSIKQRPDDTLYLISTGTLMWTKGYYWQLLLVSALKKNGLKIKLKIIGDGPDRQGLQYTIKRLGLHEEVSLEGHKPQDEVIRCLQESDIYISTSAAEGLSNSVLEAVAAGLPVVAFVCEGMNEMIENGHNGFIIPFGDLQTMCEKIQLLNNDRKLMLSMGQNGLQIATERFDYKTHIHRMVDLYESIRKGKKTLK
ncbi:MAG: glycosyltransferase family 4 protein [Spirochaetes bacterium]|nr:glycosyltransferase family 4 protein [Spirochaetota bacterium]